MPRRLLPLFLLFPVMPGTTSVTEPFFNLYRNTPRVRILGNETQRHALAEGDHQHAVLSSFAGDHALQGSSFFLREKTLAGEVPAAGKIALLFPEAKTVYRIEAAFSRRGLNRLELVFTKPLPVPDWAESLEFWAHEFQASRGYRLAYRDEAGQEFWIHFPKNRERGWQRYSGNILIRQDPDRPFAWRYRKLFVTRLVLLDDHAGKNRRTRYHLAALGASRIRRTWENRDEFWLHRQLLTFTAESRRDMDIRFTGFAGQQLQDGSGQGMPVLRVAGTLSTAGERRLLVRLRKEVRIAVCRTLRLAVRGSSRGERLFLLISDVGKNYFLVDFGRLDFTGWRKLEAILPEWMRQEDARVVEARGIRIHELIVIPAPRQQEVALELGPLSAVYDRGINPQHERPGQ